VTDHASENSVTARRQPGVSETTQLLVVVL
jgi:hypothetical protein